MLNILCLISGNLWRDHITSNIPPSPLKGLNSVASNLPTLREPKFISNLGPKKVFLKIPKIHSVDLTKLSKFGVFIFLAYRVL